MLNYWYLIPALIVAPVLAVQGSLTRRKALRMPEAAGERVGTTGQGDKLRLLILGDSAAAGVGVQTQQQALSGQLTQNLSKQYEVEWQLIAESGRTTLSTIELLQSEAQQRQFDIVLISLGVNDVTSLVRRKVWQQQCMQLTELIEQLFGNPEIIWSDLPLMGKFTALPQPLRWIVGKRRNQMRQSLVKWIARQNNVELLSFPDIFSNGATKIEDWIAEDGFHPGEKVYALWGKLAAEKIISNV